MGTQDSKKFTINLGKDGRNAKRSDNPEMAEINAILDQNRVADYKTFTNPQTGQHTIHLYLQDSSTPITIDFPLGTKLNEVNKVVRTVRRRVL